MLTRKGRGGAGIGYEGGRGTATAAGDGSGAEGEPTPQGLCSGVCSGESEPLQACAPTASRNMKRVLTPPALCAVCE